MTDPIATVREAQAELRVRAHSLRAADAFLSAQSVSDIATDLDAVVAEIERLRAKVIDADLCLQAVGEARQVLHDHFGGNIAFLDDDLIRGVVKMHEETERLRGLLADCARIVSGEVDTLPRYLCDAIDNDGHAYQSQALADALREAGPLPE